MPDAIDPHAAKLLGDLLAITLSDSPHQAQAAIDAIRRRAARDAVTAGALKQLVDQLLDADPLPDRPAISHMRWTIEDQTREIERLRGLRRRAEAALTSSQQANAALAVRVGEVAEDGRRGRAMGFLLGLACAAAAVAVYARVTAPQAGVERVEASGLTRSARYEVLGFLRSCFMMSINNVAGRSFDMHVLLDVDNRGRISGLTLAPEQAPLLLDPDRRVYSEMVTRTFVGGSCGVLPLPPSLQGKATRLDLYLSR